MELCESNAHLWLISITDRNSSNYSLPTATDILCKMSWWIKCKIIVNTLKLCVYLYRRHISPFCVQLQVDHWMIQIDKLSIITMINVSRTMLFMTIRYRGIIWKADVVWKNKDASHGEIKFRFRLQFRSPFHPVFSEPAEVGLSSHYKQWYIQSSIFVSSM